MERDNIISLNKTFSALGIICACLVVYIHLPTSSMNGVVGIAVDHFIMRAAKVAVPMFFCMSGYFLAAHVVENGWWRKQVLKRVLSLCLPYLVWNVFFLAFVFMLGIESSNLPPASSTFNLVTVFALDVISGPVLHPTWYLRALFFLVLVSPAIVFVVQKFPRPWFVIMIGFYAALSVFTPSSLAVSRFLNFGIPVGGGCFSPLEYGFA